MSNAAITPVLESGRSIIFQRRTLGVGGVSLGVSAEMISAPVLPPEHRQFEREIEVCDIELQCNWVDQLSAPHGHKLFDSGAVWSLYRCAGNLTFDFISPRFGSVPYKRLLTDRTFSRPNLLLNSSVLASSSDWYILEYPVDELLITNWLAHGNGVEIHGCGVVDSEAGGVLFVGHSGAGKSTTVSLWNELRQVDILSDDRIVLRKASNQAVMHGTPWHGEAGFASPRSAPVCGIFILEHGRNNQITALTPPVAVAELFARCFLPFFDPGALHAALSFLHQITALVPCYRFSFSPDASAVERILEFQASR